MHREGELEATAGPKLELRWFLRGEANQRPRTTPLDPQPNPPLGEGDRAEEGAVWLELERDTRGPDPELVSVRARGGSSR